MAEPKPIPGVSKPGLLKKKMPLELISSVPPFIVACVASANFLLKDETRTLGFVSAGAAVWLFGASVFKILHAKHQDAASTEQYQHHGLSAALAVLHAATAHACGFSPKESDERLRVTFHRVVPPLDKPEHIEQLVPYVGGSQSGAGRRFSIRSGITGKSIREKSVYTATLVNGDEKKRRKELKEEWGYTDHDLQTLSMDRYSSMAIPILSAHGQKALGVVYLDSDQRDLFAPEGVQAAILTACHGITTYVNQRYA